MNNSNTSLMEKNSIFRHTMTFNDREILVVQTMCMRLAEKDSLNWLKSHGQEMKTSTFYKIKAHIKGSSDKRRFELTKEGLWEQHLERIDQLETALKLAWANYHTETDATKKVRILETIVNIQPLLSMYYQASQKVVEHDAKRELPDIRHL